MTEVNSELDGLLELLTANTKTWTDLSPSADAVRSELLGTFAKPPFARARVRIVGTASDLLFLDEAAVAALEKAGTRLSFTCLWTRLNPTRFEDHPFAVETVRRYREPADECPDMVVVFAPFVMERSIARTTILFAISDHPNVPIHLVTFAGSADQLEALEGEIVDITRSRPLLHVTRRLALTAKLSDAYPVDATPPPIAAKNVPAVVSSRLRRQLERLYAPEGALALYAASRADMPTPEVSLPSPFK